MGGTSGFQGVAVIVILTLAAVGVLSAPQSKGVNVAVRAKWTGTPILLEASELIGRQGGDSLFWTFINDWLQTHKPSSPSDKECVELIVEQATPLLGSTLSPLFHFSLLLRSQSPKVVLYRQLAHESLSTFKGEEANGTGSGTGVGIGSWSSSMNPAGPLGKCCWVDVGTHVVHGISELEEWVQGEKERSVIEVYDFDHVHPESVGSFVAVLYGALGSDCFERFHSVLGKASVQGKVKYVLRPVLPSGCESATEGCSTVGAHGPVNLGGYGVELALKNMEYKAIDDSEVKKGAEAEDDRAQDDLSQEVKGFIFSKLIERKPELAGGLMTFRDHLLSSETDDDEMNVWELKDLGYQTAQRIIRASEPLRLMQDINQNFPKLVSSLSRMQLIETIKEEIVSNQRMVPPGKTLFAINGALVNPETLDLFSLLEIIERELSVAGKLADVKLPSKHIKRLLQLSEAAESGTFRLDYRSEHVIYLNNIEDDMMYRRWRSSLNELLMPLYPGQMYRVRKNLYHTVYVIDPALPSGLKMVDTMTYLYQNSVPMRFGILFMSSKVVEKIVAQGGSLKEEGSGHGKEVDVSALVIQMFLYLKENFETPIAFGFLNLVSKAVAGEADHEPIRASYAEDAFIEVLRSRGRANGHLVVRELKIGDDFWTEVEESTMFVYMLGLSQMQPCLLMNGLVSGANKGQNAIFVAMNEEQGRIQEAVYYGRIQSRTDVLDKLLSEHNAQKRYNPQIVGTKKEERKYIALSPVVAEKGNVLARLQYLHHPGTEDELKPITHWLCVDLSKKSSIRLLQQGLRYLMDSGSSKGRIGVLHNVKIPESQTSPTYSLLTRLVFSIANSPSRRAKTVPFLLRVLSLEQLTAVGKSESEISSESKSIVQILDIAEEMGLQRSFLEQALQDVDHQEVLTAQIQEESLFLARLTSLKPGANAVITNGRVFLQHRGHYFVAEDFVLLESAEYESRVKAIEAVIQEVEWNSVEPDELTSEFLSTIIMAVSSTMAVRSRSSETAHFDVLKAENSAIVLESEDANLQVDAVIDPLSATGQRITPLLVLLQEWLHPSMRIVLNPMNSLADLPLKNFYRYVVPSKNDFSLHGGSLSGPGAVFLNMPQSKTLTMNLDVPEPWLVEPVIAVHDLDNIVLEKLADERTMSAVYELEALVVTGHCYEKGGDPPRGLQLLLGTKLHPHLVDTIVMANLGYWQMKAVPGVWALQLAPGRSSQLYRFDSAGEGLSKLVVVQDLKGNPVRFEVVRRPGQEDQVLLEATKESTFKGKKKRGFLQRASEYLNSGQKQSEQGSLKVTGNKIIRKGETVNIFSIASGHLYERFLKIMMLSVLKNTIRPVKFWFIKNYLSPQFKDVIPRMAEEYGFEYGLITYKWPSWLHKQTEKQRIIWAYKILFLDVIFPLSLKRVIFVDADQIIRTDMGELYDMDIKGRPLAYTPFCENNKEMDGFRFWNQGFWRDHLNGKPYHISALYVVDLIQFRQSAAGDNLRVFYETLSKDPNSLSNLDQDLPNYAQHTVPIFSLPQQWLWCESWCGNATKAQAKTIDLCNNPMTKEPKLQGARRIVAEWPALDEEAREFTEKVLGGSSIDRLEPVELEVTEEKLQDGTLELDDADSHRKDEL